MASYTPRIVRFSLDLDVSQKNFLKKFATANDISSSILLRAMIYKLETDNKFAHDILDLIFLSSEVEGAEEEDEEGVDIDA